MFNFALKRHHRTSGPRSFFKRVYNLIKKKPRTPEAPWQGTVPVPREFVCDQSESLDGIIAYLTRVCGGNVHDKGVVNVTACTIFGSGFWPKNVVDLSSDGEYWCPHAQEAWICYDFLSLGVTLTSYSITTTSRWPGMWHLSSWCLEVSKYGLTWEVVDSHENSLELKHSHITRNFVISAPTIGAFRYVRLRVPSDRYRHACLQLCALELFGTLSHR